MKHSGENLYGMCFGICGFVGGHILGFLSFLVGVRSCWVCIGIGSLVFGMF